VPPQQSKDLRSELRRIVGRDFLYVTATDEQRHFDPITIAATFAATLFIEFLKGAAKKLSATAGEEIAKKVAKLLHDTDTPISSEDEAQLKQLDSADTELRSLGSELAESYAKEFVAAGKLSLERHLRTQNFPEAKAQRIASDFANLVMKRLTHASSS
jgi:hypothetical protein